VVAGLMRVGGWCRAISPAVVHGMLAGIGVLIVVGQFHVLFDDTPLSSGLANLLAMPAQLLGLSTGDTVTAFTVGLVTIGGMLGWEKFRPASLKLVPGALVGVLLATLVAFFLALPVARVVVPESIVAAVSLPEAGLFATMMDPAVITIAIAIAFIASAETLLSAAAVDRMHDGVRTDYNRELSAQGVGNLLCGFAGALPMTGVIVRSSANVQAGAKTRMSAVLHGVWILGFVALLPWLLREIPMAALAGILVVTGVRLVSVDHVRHLLHRYGPLPAIVWAATLICVVTMDLLTGVLVGIGLSMLELIPHLSRLRLKLEDESRGDAHEVALRGSATFLTLPKLSAKLDSLPKGGLVILNVERLGHIDHTTAEMVREWVERRRGSGLPVELFGATGRMRQLVA